MPFVKRVDHVHVVTKQNPVYKKKISVPRGEYETTVLQTWVLRGPLNPASLDASSYALLDFRKAKQWDGPKTGNVIGFSKLDFAAVKNMSNGSSIGKPRNGGKLNTKRWAFDWPEGDLRLVTYTYFAGGSWVLEIDDEFRTGNNPDDVTVQLDISEDWHVIFGVEGSKHDSVQLGWEFGPWNVWVLKSGESAGAPPPKPGEPEGPEDPEGPEGEVVTEIGTDYWIDNTRRIYTCKIDGKLVAFFDDGRESYQVDI